MEPTLWAEVSWELQQVKCGCNFTLDWCGLELFPLWESVNLGARMTSPIARTERGDRGFEGDAVVVGAYLSADVTIPIQGTSDIIQLHTRFVR